MARFASPPSGLPAQTRTVLAGTISHVLSLLIPMASGANHRKIRSCATLCALRVCVVLAQHGLAGLTWAQLDADDPPTGGPSFVTEAMRIALDMSRSRLRLVLLPTEGAGAGGAGEAELLAWIGVCDGLTMAMRALRGRGGATQGELDGVREALLLQCQDAESFVARLGHQEHQLSAEVVAGVARIRAEVEAAAQKDLTGEEIRSIMNAVGYASSPGWNGQGHWFQCPNGHPYLIADCGGATMESACPECGATIGGAQHAIRQDNARATSFLQRAQG